MNNICEFKENFFVTIYDIDYRGLLKPGSILNYFQEAATKHSTILKVNYFDLLKNREYWVLSRICVEIDKYPVLSDKNRGYILSYKSEEFRL